ncbi:hypothetical protein [Paraburkholderia unamae]|nr:hypothetical protein [Paraburkholderia unamae]
MSELDVVIVEVMPGDLVQLTVEGRDYCEEPVGVDTDEGRALLRDAGLNC